jgi:hypothetical protein
MTNYIGHYAMHNMHLHNIICIIHSALGYKENLNELKKPHDYGGVQGVESGFYTAWRRG